MLSFGAASVSVTKNKIEDWYKARHWTNVYNIKKIINFDIELTPENCITTFNQGIQKKVASEYVFRPISKRISTLNTATYMKDTTSTDRAFLHLVYQSFFIKIT